MADQKGLRTEKVASLVLSIFKGENFVVKGLRTPCRVFLKAKCADLQPEVALESEHVELTSTITDPEFNSQLAWSLTRKQLKELRSNRSIIKVTCHVVDQIRAETEVGYVVLHVKDATTFGVGVDVDPTKASTFPLLGTRDHWRTLQPRLQMILHLEDIPQEKRTQNAPSSMNQNTIKSNLGAFKPEQRQEDQEEHAIKNAAKLSGTKPVKDVNKFVWTVKDEDSVFQLNEPAEDDDLYILNITVISASYLHSLWDGKSPRKSTDDNNFWQIKYEAYGSSIVSDPFLLANEDSSRRTFIGDKATARIRANAAVFFEYLQDTTLQFQIIRHKLATGEELKNPEVMGVCFASLLELTYPDQREHRVTMDIMSEWGTPRVVSVDEKPEVRVQFSMEAVPNYFKLCNSVSETNNNVIHPRDICVSNSNNHAEIKTSDPQVVHGAIISSNGNQVNERTNVKSIIEDVADGIGSAGDTDFEMASNTSNARRLLQFEDQTRQNGSPPPSSSSFLTSPEKLVSDKNNNGQQHKLLSSSCNFSESDDDDETSNKENLVKSMPPAGVYDVTIELNRFWLKSRRVIQDNFVLSYTHPPLEIVEKPVECYGQPLETDLSEPRQGFFIMDGEFTKTFTITHYSEGLLNEPLTVEFFRTANDTKSKCFASSMLPFGRIFLEKGHDNVWIMESSSDILKVNQNVKIGTLCFKIKLVKQSNPPARTERKTTNQKQSAFFPPSNTKENKASGSPEKYFRQPDRKEKVTEDMRGWRRTQEEMYKRQKEETETAYLKILSQEAAKRDAERENVLSKKVAELEKKNEELNRQRKSLEEKEDKLRQFDIELKDRERKLGMDQESLQQHASLAQRRMEEDHKIKVESLKHRIHEFQNENEKLKTKVLLLEKKLEAKEAEIDNLMALKRELPDVQLSQRVSLLEQENKSLKNQLREANGKKEQYKKQSLALCQKLNRIQEERDQELKNQNENLRLQILASKEQKELKKERKAVQDLSQTIKSLHKETVAPAHRDGKGDHVDVSYGSAHRSELGTKSDRNTCKAQEDEIRRLTTERNRLLETGAYTNYDSVIKEMEKRMISLARQ